MCLYDEGEGPVEMIARDMRRARFEHKCAECRRTISAGERYQSERFVFDGDFTHHKTCVHCLVVRGWLSEECGGYLFGGVQEDIEDHAREGMYSRGVYRLAVGMRWKWRTPSGKAMLLPVMPQTTHERAFQVSAQQ